MKSAARRIGPRRSKPSIDSYIDSVRVLWIACDTDPVRSKNICAQLAYLIESSDRKWREAAEWLAQNEGLEITPETVRARMENK